MTEDLTLLAEIAGAVLVVGMLGAFIWMLLGGTN